MVITFATSKLRKQCNSLKEAQRKWGTVCGELVMARLDDIKAADNVKQLRSLPQTGCHQLSGNRAGQWAVNVQHPYRLIFEPANDPTPKLPDGGIDEERITAVRILGVHVDYH
jgi:proteic killer suppression protein